MAEKVGWKPSRSVKPADGKGWALFEKGFNIRKTREYSSKNATRGWRWAASGRPVPGKLA
jgi:hypothetical protein